MISARYAEKPEPKPKLHIMSVQRRHLHPYRIKSTDPTDSFYHSPLKFASQDKVINIRFHRALDPIQIHKSVLRVQPPHLTRTIIHHTEHSRIERDKLAAGSRNNAGFVESRAGEGGAEADGCAIGEDGERDVGARNVVGKGERDTRGWGSLAAESGGSRGEGGEEGDEDGCGLHFECRFGLRMGD